MGESTVTVERKRGYEIISKAEVAKIGILFFWVCAFHHNLSLLSLLFLLLYCFRGVGEKHKKEK